MKEKCFEHTKNISLQYDCLKHALIYYCDAYIEGKAQQAEKDQTWLIDLDGKIKKVVKKAIPFLKSAFDLEKRIDLGFQFDIACKTEFKVAKAHLLFALSEWIFNQAIIIFEKKNFSQSHSLLDKCLQQIDFGLSLVKNIDFSPDLIDEAKTRKDEAFLQMCVAESAKIMKVADELLTKELEVSEDTNIHQIWTILDLYRQAIMGTKGNDVETEAKAKATIGKIYYQVLKIQEKSRVFFEDAIKLAQSMHPRVFTNDQWFKDANKFLAEIQELSKLSEEEATAKKKEPIL